MLCVERGFQRLKGDASVTISRVVGNIILALVVGMSYRKLLNLVSLADDSKGAYSTIWKTTHRVSTAGVYCSSFRFFSMRLQALSRFHRHDLG